MIFHFPDGLEIVRIAQGHLLRIVWQCRERQTRVFWACHEERFNALRQESFCA